MSVSHQAFHKLLSMKISDLTIESPGKLAKFKYFLDWPRLRAVSVDLSKKINELLDDPNTKINVDDYILYLEDIPLWIANFPYYYGILNCTSIVESLKSELVYRDPSSPEWKRAKEDLKYIDELCEKYGNKCPNFSTIWRLRQVELATRKLVNKLINKPFCS